MPDQNTQIAVDNKLVDRRVQIDKFNSILSRIQRRRPISETLLEWYGGPGIGKSTLVKLLSQECEKKDIPWILVDFKDLNKRGNNYLDDPTLFIEELIGLLAKQVEIDHSALMNKIEQYRLSFSPQAVIESYFKLSRNERLYQKPSWLSSLQEVMIEFVSLIQALTPSEQQPVQPLVMFFDETEYANVHLIDWIEEWIINPLAQMKHCLIIWTARSPWRWKRPEIRRRMQSEQLLVFEAKDVKKQFQSLSSSPDLAQLFFKDVHVVTGGQPFANAVVISQLNGWQAAGQTLTPENFSEREIELFQEVFRQFIWNYAFERLSEDEKIACELLAVVRSFDTTMLREILKSRGGKEFAGWEQEDFGDLLLRLKRTQLLIWNKGKGGYALDPALGYIIRNYLLACEPDVYLQVNQTALKVYQNWLKRPVDNRTMFVIEELYHYAALCRAGQSINLEDELTKRLQYYPQWITDGHALGNALERLRGELKHDAELAQITDEISTTTFVDQVNKFLASISTNEDHLHLVAG